MTRTLKVFLAAVAAAAMSAPSLAAQKKGAPAEQKYDVSFTFDEATYSGTMTLKLGASVTGAMNITEPMQVTGDVAGTLKKDELALDYAYSMAGDQPCTGRVTVTAKMSPDRSSATGTAHATGCSDHELDGTVTLKKSAEGKPQ
jgi:hypothetical protein